MKPSHGRVVTQNRAIADTGAKIVIVAFVSVFFVDLSVATIGGFEITAQKLTAIFVLPFGLILMHRLYLPSKLTIVTVGYLATFSVAEIFSKQEVPGYTAAITAALLVIASTYIFYTALRVANRPILLLANVWVVLAVVSSIIAFLQMLGMLPLFNVADNLVSRRDTGTGLVRGSGFKSDPNFAAFMLVVGIAFSALVRRRGNRIFAQVILMAGILATFSRMGLLLALVLVLVMNRPGARNGWGLSTWLRIPIMVAAFLASTMVIMELLPSGVSLYLRSRFEEMLSGVGSLFGIQTVDAGSAVERSVLLEATMEIIRESPALGVGPNRLQELMYSVVGVAGKGAHNTILETLAIGGMVGAATLLLYFVFTALNLRYAFRTAGPEQRDQVTSVIMACLALGLMSLALTLNYNLVFWLPFVLAASIADNNRSMLSHAEEHKRSVDALSHTS